jgi:hypothetical protein
MEGNLLPDEGVAFEIMGVFYESILARARITPESGTDAYPALIETLKQLCDNAPLKVGVKGAPKQPFAGERKAVEVKIDKVFGRRAYDNLRGVGARFMAMLNSNPDTPTQPKPLVPTALITEYIKKLPEKADVTIQCKRRKFDGGGFYYMIGLKQGVENEDDDRLPAFHITIPEEPTVIQREQYMVHFKNESTFFYRFCMFSTPKVTTFAETRIPKTQAPAPAAAAPERKRLNLLPRTVPLPAAAVVPAAQAAAPAAAAPSQGRYIAPHLRKGGRKTRRSRRVRRTRRR